MFLLLWRHLLTIFSISAIGVAINRPVYKIVLNSKGYAQFIQYDIDVPQLREFTLCVWLRVTSIDDDQSIFTYVGTDDKRIMRLWLDSGGRQLRISLDHDRVTSSAAVEFTAGAWRDVCVSYQADHGAWALYVDAKLLLCEGSRKLRGFKFPGKGSLIIGYGTSEKGFPTGLSGEVYGASMILFSTIERNSTVNMEPWNRQKNTVTAKNNQENQYVVLGDLQRDEIQTAIPFTLSKEYEILSSDLTSQPLRDNMKVFSRHSPHITSVPNKKKAYDFSIEENRSSYEKDNKDLNKTHKSNNIKVPRDFKKELTGSGTHDLPIVLEYETPPSITASTSDYSIKNPERGKSAREDQHDDIMISDIEKPPPPEYDTKVYGQWTNSKFSNNVLKYLKNINFNTNKKQKKIMSTFPVEKLSDSYPYPSEFTYAVIRPPINYKKRIHNTEKRHNILRRDIKKHQVNVQIIDPVESHIILPFKNVNPKFVEVTNRGETKRELKSKLYESVEDNTPFVPEETSHSHNSLQRRPIDIIVNTSERHRDSNLMKILPYLKSKEYFVNNRHTKTNQPYSISLSSNNQWYKVYQRLADMADRKLPLLEDQSEHSPHKQMQVSKGDSIIVGRALAKEVSNQAKQNIYNVPLLKYKHELVSPISKNKKVTIKDNFDNKEPGNPTNFNKQVKLGNALNEQFIIGYDEHQIKNTFLGGDEAIPDINKYRSKSNSKIENIPASLEARVCENLELYVHEDESIGKSKIKSPLQRKNIAIEFIAQSYKKCSNTESSLKGSALILIDWIVTPVKLFGGAYAKKTKDLCGFF